VSAVSRKSKDLTQHANNNSILSKGRLVDSSSINETAHQVVDSTKNAKSKKRNLTSEV
jgi:hypothetical protein